MFLGQKEGLYRKYHDNGKLCLIAYYVHGERHGEYIEYFNTGELYEHSFYEGNRRIKVIYDWHTRWR